MMYPPTNMHKSDCMTSTPLAENEGIEMEGHQALHGVDVGSVDTHVAVSADSHDNMAWGPDADAVAPMSNVVVAPGSGNEEHVNTSVLTEDDTASVECHAGTAADDQGEVVVRIQQLLFASFLTILTDREEAIMHNVAHAAFNGRLRNSDESAFKSALKDIEKEVCHAGAWAYEANHDFGTNLAKDEFEAEGAFVPNNSQTTIF